MLSFNVKGQEGVIPAVGLGTATIKGDACVSAVVEALKLGYPLLDTALLVCATIALPSVSASCLFLTNDCCLPYAGSKITLPL